VTAVSRWGEFEAVWKRRTRRAKQVPKISPLQLLAALDQIEQSHGVPGATPLSAAARFIRGLDLIENGRWRRSAFVPLADDGALMTLIPEYEIEEGSRRLAVARYAAEDGTPGASFAAVVRRLTARLARVETRRETKKFLEKNS
jgi:hypothetical protein